MDIGEAAEDSAFAGGDSLTGNWKLLVGGIEGDGLLTSLAFGVDGIGGSEWLSLSSAVILCCSCAPDMEVLPRCIDGLSGSGGLAT